MPPQTNTDRINQLARDVAVIGAKLDERTSVASVDVDVFEKRIGRIEEELKLIREKVAAIEVRAATSDERLRSLERNSDRGWQVWLSVVAAGFAFVVAILKK